MKNQSELTKLGSESSRTDGLVNTRVYKEVAMAKLSTNKTQSVCGGSNPY